MAPILNFAYLLVGTAQGAQFATAPLSGLELAVIFKIFPEVK